MDKSLGSCGRHMSGSMCRDDVKMVHNVARTGYGWHWQETMSRSNSTTGPDRTAPVNDLVNVIVMKEDADAPLILEPIDWVLYNRLVDMRENGVNCDRVDPGTICLCSRGSRASLGW
jgi:hypothetical protein